MHSAAKKLTVVDGTPATPGFLTADEDALSRRFLDQGHVVFPVENRASLDRLRKTIADSAAAWLGIDTPADVGAFLDTIHTRVGPEKVNDLRMAAIRGVNGTDWTIRTYFSLARTALATLVGNELAMQKRLNLSIQMPGDQSSVLATHADSWDGDSPFEVVLWVPLVNVYGSKCMFLLKPEQDAKRAANFGRFAGKSTEDLYRDIEPDLIRPEVRYGEAMIFSPNLMHGNRVNTERDTRWSFNCRVKGLFTPYADKRLGEFFEPVTMRATTRMGLDYREPEGFDE